MLLERSELGSEQKNMLHSHTLLVTTLCREAIDGYAEKKPVKLDNVSLKDGEKQKKYIAQKKEVFTEIGKLFSKMILIPKREKT